MTANTMASIGYDTSVVFDTVKVGLTIPLPS